MTGKENKQTKINQFRKIVIIIPETNKETMKVLFSHLLRFFQFFVLLILKLCISHFNIYIYKILQFFLFLLNLI